MSKFMYILKIVLYFCLFMIFFLSTLTVDAVIENIKVDSQISDFISNAVFKEEVNNIRYYEVDIPQVNELSSPTIQVINNIPKSTTKGDIFVSRESVLEVLPFSAQFISFYFGGHAGIVLDQYTVIETTGMESNPDNNVVIKGFNSIITNNLKRSVIGLRVNASDEEINKAIGYLDESIGKKYNYSFIFNRKNTYYCTDLVARAFSKEAGLDFDLDKDGIAVSCNDLVISDDTFITYYSYYEGDILHLYYAI